MQIVTGRRGEPHVTSRQMQAVYRSFLGDFALLDIGEKLRAEAYSNDIVRVYDGVVSVQGIYAVIAYNQYDEVYIEPVSVGKKRIDTIVLHYTKNNTLDVEDMQLDVVQGEEYTDNPIAPVVPEGGDAWEGTTDIQVAIYDVEVTNFGLTVTPYARMLTVIPTLDSIAERIPETVVTGVKGDSEVLYRDGNVNITKANIGLGNVDNTADTDKPISTATQTALNLKADLTYVDAKIAAAYHAGGNKTVAELTSALLIAENMGKVFNMSDSGVTTSDFVEGAGEPINEGDNVGICNVGTEESPVYKFDLLSGFVDLSAYATTSAVNTGLAGKVDKVTGKGLSTEDYTTTEKTKLAGISEGATQTIANPADTATETLSKLEVEGVVYDIPQGASGATELSELTDVNLSGTAEGDILEYDSTANKWKNTNALQGAKTASGNPITVTDAAPVNAVNLSMDLEPIQDLHGYDHPWVGGAGKNKFIQIPNEIDDGIKFTPQEDGSIRIHGTNNSGAQITSRLSGNNFNQIYLPIGTYTMSIQSALPNGCSMDFSGGSGNGMSYGSFASATSLTRTVTDATKPFDYIAFYIQNGITLDYILKFQIESGSSATTWESYSNICPISGRSEVAIQRVGKNLALNSPSFSDYYFTDYWTLETEKYNGNEVRSRAYAWNGMYFIRTLAPGTYTFSCYAKTNDTSCECQLHCGEVDGVQIRHVVTIDNTWKRYSMTFTIQENTTVYPKFEARVSNKTIYVSSYQLEKNSEATTYEPYAGKTYTIQLGDTVYGGTLDVTRGKMVVDRAIRLVSECTWYGSNGELYTDSVRSSIKHGDGRFDHVISSVYETQNVGTYSQLSNGEISVDASGYIQLKDSRYSTESDFKTNMGTTQLVYELAEPYTIQLTPQQIKLLENTNTLSSDSTLTLEYQPNNAIGEAVRAVEESYDPEFAVRPVLKKKAFSGTTDSDGSVTLINASDIPSNHRIIPLQITDMTIDGNAGTYFVEYEPYNSGDAVKGYCYFYMSGSQMFPVGKAITGNFYYYDLEV